MTRIGLGVLLGALALACAPISKTIQGRGVWHNVSGDVKEVSPGHWAGPYKSVGVSIDNVGQKDEDAMSWEQEGFIDMVWKSPTELVSCTNKNTEVTHHRDGNVTTGENTMICKVGPDGKLIFEGTGKKVSGMPDIEATWTFTAYQLTRGPGDVGYSVYTTTNTKMPK
jgi:hypothetical protein